MRTAIDNGLPLLNSFEYVAREWFASIAHTIKTWIQVINAIPEFMQLCVQLVQKTPHEVFGNLTLFEGGG